jgi:hypothetical protein
LKADNIQHTVKRSYKKITEFLAGLTALLVNLLICLGIVIKMVNNLKARQCIIKRVMKYNDYLGEDGETQETLKDLQKEFDTKDEIKAPNRDKEGGQITIDRDGHDEDDAALIKQNRDNLRKKYSVGACDFIAMLVCCRKKTKKEIFLKAEKKLFYNIDILTYMKKMQELEIIKYMLLDEESLKLVNFISKPGVSYVDRSGDKANPFFYNGEDFKVEPDYKKELRDIKLIYKKLKNNTNQSEGVKKIMNLFESQVNEIITPNNDIIETD